MYKLNQLSLKEYQIVNESFDTNIYYRVEIFEDKTFKGVDSVKTISPGTVSKVILPYDGIYRLTISNNDDVSNPLDTYFIHNITDLVTLKQDFITKVLLEHSKGTANTKHYYDIISFFVLFDTYNKIVREEYIQKIYPKNLYRIDYLHKQLKKYY